MFLRNGVAGGEIPKLIHEFTWEKFSNPERLFPTPDVAYYA